MNAKLALRAITLRGIGSYLHGARLDIRPLMILCGTNGSGKSTWFAPAGWVLRGWMCTTRSKRSPYRVAVALQSPGSLHGSAPWVVMKFIHQLRW